MSGGKSTSRPFPYARMEMRQEALDRLDLKLRFGDYGIRVLRCHLARFPGGHIIPYHQHSEYEFHFIAAGKGEVVIGQERFKLREGLFYLTGPGVVHQQWSDPEEPMDELCLHCEIIPLEDGVNSRGGWGEELERQEAARAVEALRNAPLRPVADKHEAMACFLRAYRLWEEQPSGFYTLVTQEMRQILLRAANSLSPELEAGGRSEVPRRDMGIHRLELAKQYMRDNAFRPITVDEVAEAVGISTRQLQRLFAQVNEQSFRDELEQLRLAQVCHELLTGDKPIEDIAIECGFVTPNYLYPVFKKRYGVTPAEYRKQTRLERDDEL